MSRKVLQLNSCSFDHLKPEANLEIEKNNEIDRSVRPHGVNTNPMGFKRACKRNGLSELPDDERSIES